MQSGLRPGWENFPYVSVVVPVFNGRSLIGDCIESLLALDYPAERIEIIIVDNGSTDGTDEVVKGYPVRLLYEKEKKGSYAARNAGIKNAKGEIIAFTDADCVVSREWLKKGVGFFRESYIGCVAGGISGYRPQTWVDEFLIRRDCLSQRWTLSHPFFPYPQTANALYRKDVFEKIDGFGEEFLFGGDADMAWRMQIETGYKLIYEPEAVVYHRHRSNLRGFLSQQFRWGYGGGLLYMKYRDQMRGRGFYPLRDNIRRLFSTPLILGRRMLRLLLGRGEGEKFVDLLLDFLSNYSWMFGFFRAVSGTRSQYEIKTWRG